MNEKKFDQQFEQALKAGEEANRTEARAAAARYDPVRKEIVVDLRDGSPFSFPADWVPGFKGASDEQLSEIEITPSGEGLHWRLLDEDLSLPALIRGTFGPDDGAEAGSAEFDTLCSEIEAAWAAAKDPSIVDRYSERFPMYSTELYEFFSQLIDSELASESEGISQSAETARTWLEAEGFQAVRDSISEKGPTTTTPTQDWSVAPAVTPKPLIQSGSEPRTQPPSGKILSFAAYARELTGLRTPDIAEKIRTPLALLVLVQDEAPNTQLRIRGEIAVRSEELGLNGRTALESLQAPQQKAALNTSTGPPQPFKVRLSQIGLTKEELAFWLALADEDE